MQQCQRTDPFTGFLSAPSLSCIPNRLSRSTPDRYLDAEALGRERRTREGVEVEVVLEITRLPRERAGACELLGRIRGHGGARTAYAASGVGRSVRTRAGSGRGPAPR